MGLLKLLEADSPTAAEELAERRENLISLAEAVEDELASLRDKQGVALATGKDPKAFETKIRSLSERNEGYRRAIALADQDISALRQAEAERELREAQEEADRLRSVQREAEVAVDDALATLGTTFDALEKATQEADVAAQKANPNVRRMNINMRRAQLLRAVWDHAPGFARILRTDYVEAGKRRKVAVNE